MINRISKIARLPHEIREQLNRRLQNGQMGRTIVKWLNDLPETKETITEYFDGHAITHQNLSEWRRTGYQDWLLHQDRLLWYERLSEQETEIDQHNHSGDGFETMGSLFLYEIGQALTVMHQIKNPHDRCNRLETLAREFARLQNAFNWSRRVQLEYDKHNANHRTEPSGTGVSPVSSCSHRRDARATKETDGETANLIIEPRSSRREEAQTCLPPSTSPENNPPPLSDNNPSPSPITLAPAETPPHPNSQTPQLPNSPTPNHLQPNPTPATTIPSPHQITPHFLEEINKIRKTRNLPAPARGGHRFICIEG